MGALRLFLALVVALAHFQASWLQPDFGIALDWHFTLGVNAGFAVMWFYMISGFLMSLVLAEKYPATASGNYRFYSARFIRIFSLYWPLVLYFIFAVDGVWDTLLSYPWPDRLTNVILLGADWRVGFADYPALHWNAVPPLMGQAWTLGAELTFYCLAPFLLRSWKLGVAALIASAAIRATCIVAVGGFNSSWTYMFFPATVLFFLLGHFGRVAAGRFAVLRRPAMGLALLALSFGTLVSGEPAVWDGARFWVAAVCFAASLPGFFAATRDLRVLNALGDLSYPLYLVHVLAIVYLAKLVPLNVLVPWAGHDPDAVCAVVALWLVGAAAVTHWLLERPAAYAMRAGARLAGGVYASRLSSRKTASLESKANVTPTEIA